MGIRGGARGVLTSLQSPPKLWGLLFCLLGPQYLFQRDLPRGSGQIWGHKTCLPDWQAPRIRAEHCTRTSQDCYPPKGKACRPWVARHTCPFYSPLSDQRTSPSSPLPQTFPNCLEDSGGRAAFPPLWGMGHTSKNTQQP